MQKFLIGFFGCGIVLISCVAGLTGGFLGTRLGNNSLNLGNSNNSGQDLRVVNQQEAIIDVAKQASQSVVSVVVSQRVSDVQNLRLNPFLEEFGFEFPNRQQGEQEITPNDSLREVGAGTGFIISQDGMIITNRHVVDEENAQFTVILNDERRFEATVLAKDSLLDIAFLKIEAEGLPALNFGDSSSIQVGQSVIAIGNALGEFSNTVSSGIVSGLGRNITATDSFGGSREQLYDVIQTDASINSGNSGGPLLDLSGNVIGVNVAVANDANGIGFAIPSNVVSDLLNRLNTDGEIVRPRLGVRFRMITESLKQERNLTVDDGAIIFSGNNSTEPAIVPDSPAEKAGLREGDIILSVDDVMLTQEKPLNVVIQGYKVGDQVSLVILRGSQELTINVVLEK